MRLEATGHRRDLVVVVDDDPVMEFWVGEVSAFVAVLRAQRAFASVEVRRMVVDDGALLVTGGPDTVPATPADLVDPAGRRVVFLLTHGGSDAWRGGLVQPVLALWAASMTVAVVNLLPQQRWRERGMETTEVTWSLEGSDSVTSRSSWRVSGLDLRPLDERDDTRLTAVPVIECGTDWLQRWSRLLTRPATGDVQLPALLLPPDGSTGRRLSRSLTAHDLVARFRAVVSPASFTLAVRLAAAPLNARVAGALLKRVVRSGPAQLTEVLTSDLVRPVPHGGTSASDTRIRYEFVHGVRERLLTLGYRDRTVEVQHVVEYELAHDVEAVRNLTLRIKDPRNASYERVTPAAEPYLRVELAVHLSLGGPNLVAAARLGEALGSPIPRQLRRVPQPSSVIAHRTMESEMSDRVNSPDSGVSFGTTPHHTQDAGPGIIPGRLPTHDLPAGQQLPAVVGNLPLRNTNFTGRRDLLDSLHQRLRAGTTAVLPEALHGAGGVGKSQLAIEYVYLHQQDFDLIWWIPAERPAQIQSALVELAVRLDLPVPSTANTAVPAVLETLRIGRPYSNWLLIFDNAEDPDAVERFFPKGGPGSIVVTSRNGAWREVANSLPVDVFERQESIDLLRRRGPDLAVDDADRLAAALGDLPLAIEQAAAWRAETRMPADEYLELLGASRPLLDDETTTQQQDYPELVAAAWNVSLNWLRGQDPSALLLLQVCSFFAPEPIGKVLLSKPRALRIHPDLDPLVRNPIRLNRAIRTIGRLSLARIDHRTNSFQMHRLVQRVLINQMDPEDRDALRHGAHMLLAGNDPDQPADSDHWPRYAELYPHLVASGAEQCSNELVRDMVLNESKYLWRWGDHLGARDLSQRAWTAWTATTDGADPDGLRMASWLGFMHFVVGDYAASAALNTRTLELYRQTLGDDQEETLDAIGAVAADHRVAGDFAGALDRSLVVYDRAKQNFGEEEPFTLRAAHNLAVSMRLSSLFGRALQLDEQTYQRLVQIYGTDHPDSLSTLGGINLDRRELGDYLAAHSNQESVVATARRMLKYDDHPDLLRQSHMLASFRRKAGHHHDALDLSSDVLRRFRTRYGDNHPDTVLAKLTFSIDQRLTGDLRAAREAAEAAVEGLHRLYGEDHPHTAGAQVDLAVTLRLLGECEQARGLNQAALQRLTGRLGESHALVMAARINLASDHYELGDYATAHALNADTVTHCRQVLGDSHPTTLICALNRAMDLRGLGREAEAGVLFDRSLEQLRQTLGVRHPAVAAIGAGVRANCDIDPLPL